MRHKGYVLFGFLLLAGTLLLAVPSVRAVNCDGTGIFTDALNFLPPELNEDIGSITVGGRFEYKPLTAEQTDCTKESILIGYDIVTPGGSTIGHIADRTYGPIGLNQSLTFADGIPYSKVKQYVTQDGKVRVRVSAGHLLTSGADSLAETFGEFLFVVQLTPTYACIADDGKYACDTLSSCSTAKEFCTKTPACIRLTDNRLCGKPASSPPPSPTGTPPSPGTGPGGQTITFDFSISNPLKSENLLDLIKNVGDFIFTLAIPIAVIMIIYAGVMFLTSRGDTAKVGRAKEILWYAVIGLAIVLIGSGFVSLVTSILNLGSDSATPSGSEDTLPTSSGDGDIGDPCRRGSDCREPLICDVAAGVCDADF